jgi:hypothetical protein
VNPRRWTLAQRTLFLASLVIFGELARAGLFPVLTMPSLEQRRATTPRSIGQCRPVIAAPADSGRRKEHAFD